MKLDNWTNQATPADAARRRRLTIGYIVGAGTVALAMTLVTYSAHGRAYEEEDTIDVTLARAPVIDTDLETEAKPTPPKQATKKKRKRSAHSKPAGPPKEIPNSVPEEADPASASAFDGDLDDLFDGEAGDGVGDTQRVTVNRKPVRKTEPAARRPPAPVLVAEREKASAPVALTRSFPTYPEAAREQGVEATVIVRFVVGSDGGVHRVKIVKGHPLLNAAVIETLREWRFQPGTYDGHPVAMWRSARFPFRLSS